MDTLKLTNLNVDLVANTAQLVFNKHGVGPNGKHEGWHIGIGVPVNSPGNDQENVLRAKAINQAKAILQEALRVLG